MAQLSTAPAANASVTWLRYFINILLALIAFAFVLVLAFPIGFYGMAMYISPSLPSLDELKQAKTAMPHLCPVTHGIHLPSLLILLW